MNLDRKYIFIIVMIVLAAASRLIPHPHNFTPIAAIGLFGAAHMKPRYLAFLIPLLALWLSDLILMNGLLSSFYDGFQWFGHIWVYAAFLLIIGIGFLLRGRVKWNHVLGASLGSSLVFFLITNFGVWLASSVYPANIAGLMASYVAGLPFFLNTLAGDLFYCGLLFGSFAWFTRYYVATEKAQ